MKTSHIQVVFNSGHSGSDKEIATFLKDVKEHAEACGGTVIRNCVRTSTVNELRETCYPNRGN